jgi:hypothetical protein
LEQGLAEHGGSDPIDRKGDCEMEKDQNREPQENEEGQEDLEVGSEQAEGVTGGLRPSSDPDAGAQRA